MNKILERKELKTGDGIRLILPRGTDEMTIEQEIAEFAEQRHREIHFGLGDLCFLLFKFGCGSAALCKQWLKTSIRLLTSAATTAARALEILGCRLMGEGGECAFV